LPYLTPDEIPTDTICRALVIPNDREFIGCVTGALQELTFAHNWEDFGTLTAKQASEALLPMFNGFCFQEGICRMVGEIILWSGDTSPSIKWLVCDGANLLRTDYPDLFAVIGTIYGAADGSHFSLPDLRSRVAIGAGTGAGLSAYAIGDNLGEETHTLTTSETPSHSHSDTGHTHTEGIAFPAIGAAIVGVPIPSSVPTAGVTGIGFAGISNTGGDGAHNNIQPVLALNYLIVALP
jgi:microcystin-dependent protein